MENDTLRKSIQVGLDDEDCNDHMTNENIDPDEWLQVEVVDDDIRTECNERMTSDSAESRNGWKEVEIIDDDGRGLEWLQNVHFSFSLFSFLFF